MKLFTLDAIVLRSIDCGEGNRLLVIFSREQGKLKVMAHGVAKPSSRKRGFVQLFSRSSFLIHRGRELDSVSQCEGRELFPSLRSDLEGISRASYIAELADAFTLEGQANEELFWLLLNTFRMLETKKDLELLTRAFELKIVTVLGYRPVLETCAACGGELLPGKLAFSPAMGGVLCDTCSHLEPDAVPCNKGQVELLKMLISWEPARLHQLRAGEANKKQLRVMLQRYIRYYLERELKSAAFLSRYV
ncbi:MAG: DNA repair protein RecO [Peptococcaceae bacterium]|nr:DNA repair protein RecO [Peptococcaceae bacterium]